MKRLLELLPISKDAAEVRTEILEALEPWQEKPVSLKACIERYFERSDAGLVSRIEGLARTLPPMEPLVEATICVPVVSFGNQDTEAMCRMLLRLDKANENGPSTEVIVLPNWPRGKSCDDTPEVATGIRCEHLQTHILPVELLPEEQSAGYYRALMHGVTLLRTLERGKDDIAHITLDADTVQIAQGYVGSFVRALQCKGTDAVIGQLDWDNETIPTSRVPELFVGNELMRLLPKYGNWQVLSKPQGYSDVLVQECVFSRRSFGRGVQANLAWTGFAYARVGGYRPEAHDEMDYILRKIAVVGGLGNLGFGWNEVAVLSDSRRALWALKKCHMPPMRQWSVSFVADDFVRYALPDMAPHIGDVSTTALERQINLTLEAFNLPEESLRSAVMASLKDMGLGHNDYELNIGVYEPDPVLAVAEIKIVSDSGLRSNIQRARHH